MLDVLVSSGASVRLAVEFVPAEADPQAGVWGWKSI